MDREGFRNRLKQYKEAKGFYPQLSYWEWKQKYDSAPQPDSMPGQPQPDQPTVTSQPLDNISHRWDNGYSNVNRDPFDSPYDDARYHDYRKPRFEFRKGGVHYGNPNVLKWMGRFGKVLRGGSLLGEAVQNLFPSEEAEAMEALRVKMDKQNKWLTGQEDIPKYDEGTDGAGEPGLWDKFTNTVSVLYNNAARKVKSFFTDDQTGEVIDLTNKNMSRITPNTDRLTAIYGNEFVENNANNIRTRKNFEHTTDTLIGDNKIRLSKISNFYGIENGKLKSGNISIFDQNSTVIPNRAKNIGKVKEIIFNDPLTEEQKDSLKTIWQEEEDKKDIQFAKLADSLGVDYGRNIFSKPFYGTPYSNLLKRYNAAKHNDNEKEFVQRFDQILKQTPTQQDIWNQLDGGGMSYVTEKNDTIPVYKTKMPTLTKNLYADEYGNSLFINNLKNLTKQQQQQVNNKLKINPMYPILIDNGRYQHYQTTLPNYNTYTSFDFARDPKNMYVIGTIEK